MIYQHEYEGDGRCAWCGVHFLDATGSCWSGSSPPAGDDACGVGPGTEPLPAVGDELAAEDGPAADPAGAGAAGFPDMHGHDPSVRGET